MRTGDRFNRAAQAALYSIPYNTLYNRTQRYTLHSYTSRSGPIQPMHTPLWRTSGAGCDQPLRKRAEGRGGGRRGRTGASALKSAKATFGPSVDRSSFVSLPNPEGGCPGVGGEGRVAPLPACSRATIKILNVRASPLYIRFTLHARNLTSALCGYGFCARRVQTRLTPLTATLLEHGVVKITQRSYRRKPPVGS